MLKVLPVLKRVTNWGRKGPLYFFLCRARTLFLTGGDSNSMCFGGGVMKTLGFDVSLVAFSLKGFSAACIFPPVLQAKLDVSRCEIELHLGHSAVLSDSPNESLNSNSCLHWGQTFSYIGISSSLLALVGT